MAITISVMRIGETLAELVSLFMVILNAGYFIYCMGIRQGVEMPYSTLTEGLSVAGEVVTGLARNELYDAALKAVQAEDPPPGR